MSSKTITTCDRCETETKTKPLTVGYNVPGAGCRRFDICDSCEKSLDAWLAGTRVKAIAWSEFGWSGDAS